jgi:phosphoserine aminotransferase
MVALIKKTNLPENYDIIFSDSGKQKDLINEEHDRHTKIFTSLADLNTAGYVDSSAYDLIATKWFSKNKKIGLIFH